MSQRVLEPGEIQNGAAPQATAVVLPDAATVFSTRAQRLRQLASGHALADYLQFIAHIADAQQHALAALTVVSLPDAATLDLARTHRMPPLNALSGTRDAGWRHALSAVLKVAAQNIAGVAREHVLRVADETASTLEAQADRILRGVTAGLDFAGAPLIAAGLQVYWVAQVTKLGASALAPLDVPTVCPACGMRPVASVVRAGAGSGQRYLHCALCSTEWHMVRIKCTDCESTTGIQYYAIEGEGPVVKAEVCSDCGGYLKVMSTEQGPFVEPTADDLASMSLDLLMADAGRLRTGPNLMLFSADES